MLYDGKHAGKLLCNGYDECVMTGNVTVLDMCPLTILNTCHPLVKTRIAFCYHLGVVCLGHACYSCNVCKCMCLSLCVCVLEWSCTWAHVSRWSCQRAVSMVMVLTRLACMRRGGAQSCSQRSIENLLHQDWRTENNKMQICPSFSTEIVKMKWCKKHKCLLVTQNLSPVTPTTIAPCRYSWSL